MKIKHRLHRNRRSEEKAITCGLWAVEEWKKKVESKKKIASRNIECRDNLVENMGKKNVGNGQK